MALVKDPKEVARRAETLAESNWAFRAFLKMTSMSSDEVDAAVHRHYEEVARGIDCCTCGHCCREMGPVLIESDVERLAKVVELSPAEYSDRYTAMDGGDRVFNQRPCPFLEGNHCSVYEHRPQDCRSYPHLQKDGFTSRLAGIVQSCSVCPITFNVYERLKEELWDEECRIV